MKLSVNFHITALLIMLLPFMAQGQSNEIAIKKIVFGYYSFKSSKLKEYIINSHREILYTDKLDRKLSLIGELPKSEAKKLFKTANESGILTVNLDSPGRDYYFIELIGEDNSKHRLVWEKNPSKEVAEFYTYLENIITLVTSNNESQVASK